ncbi:hypothetical protein FKG94_05165 [Exilibacterium tricleocarpae]|uniref:Uncharacterized protein n=1 Tax=Exilibacterium tricleocarpae TaxID=2591008 RepID=A0A545U3J7_9GAMM|nr:hypothetical protein [Exilibacterium tricleocarpae]TQV84057.1 hypothetical protein FKG94_05165 [Exilibacterium tricleocarpae]
MKIPGLGFMTKAGGSVDKNLPSIPKPVPQANGQANSQQAREAMQTYIQIAKAGKLSTMAISIGLRYLEQGQGEANFMERPTCPTGRPKGDNRTAEQIIEDNPVLKNLGDQKDIKREELKKQCGDWTEANPDKEDRANAAYNMAKVLNYIDTCQNREGGDRKNSGDANIEGITSCGDARRGTEAGMLKDFAEQGYGSLPENHQLDQTKDSHVRLDGSNKDNFQWVMGEIGKVLSKIPILRSATAPFFEALGEGRGLGDTIAKGFMGLAQNAFGAVTTVAGGPASIAATAATDAVSIGVEEGIAATEDKDKSS